MLSKMQGLTPIDPPRTVRIRFRKVGKLQYISHLDLQRTMQHCIKRSGIPAWYTKGFNPHYKLVFALPLPVGAESECELLDLRIDREISDAEILRRFNETVTDELRGLEAYTPTTKFADIAWAEYAVTLTGTAVTDGMAAEAERILTTSPLMMVKRSKSGEREVDLVPMIRSVRAEGGAGELTLRLVLSAAGADYLNPELVVTALRERLWAGVEHPDTLSWRILREQVYCADGQTTFR
ncbi:MAG: TIGR03936 family radical SAM-associated protein [Clostridia bacterium]|nr:TIGR03936 family radical SAM-associated protein [Clostridia bacterium]